MKSCPFCGNNAKIFPPDEQGNIISCELGHAPMRTIEAWETRANVRGELFSPPHLPHIALTNHLNDTFMTLKALKDANPWLKNGYQSTPGSWLNAYREGDISFDEVVSLIESYTHWIRIYSPAGYPVEGNYLVTLENGAVAFAFCDYTFLVTFGSTWRVHGQRVVAYSQVTPYK